MTKRWRVYKVQDRWWCVPVDRTRPPIPMRSWRAAYHLAMEGGPSHYAPPPPPPVAAIRSNLPTLHVSWNPLQDAFH